MWRTPSVLRHTATASCGRLGRSGAGAAATVSSRGGGGGGVAGCAVRHTSSSSSSSSPPSAAGDLDRRCFSGIQSSGTPHIGNYIGAVQNWVKLQHRPGLSKVYYSVVDFHSITVRQDPDELRRNTRDTAIALLAAGIDPDKAVLFQQSRVAAHAELGWILGCMTGMGKLRTMTQWKTKTSSSNEQGLGLFAYPVLMTADILLYRATDVPVGEDQQQHLELACGIARKFNGAYGPANGGAPFFPIPEPIIGEAPRLMSLRDPTKKMSKSDFSVASRIDLTDGPDVVRKRLSKALTDAIPEIYYDPENRPGVSNLLRIYAALAPGRPLGPGDPEVARVFDGMNMAQLKACVTDTVNEHLAPIQAEIARLTADQGYVDLVLDRGAATAAEEAAVTMEQVRRLVGLR